MTERHEEIASLAKPRTLNAIDRFAADDQVHVDRRLTRSEAIAFILDDWLVAHGYLPFEDADD